LKSLICIRYLCNVFYFKKVGKIKKTLDKSKRRDNNKQDAQLSQRDRAAGCVIVFAKSRRLELEDNILRTL